MTTALSVNRAVALLRHLPGVLKGGTAGEVLRATPRFVQNRPTGTPLPGRLYVKHGDPAHGATLRAGLRSQFQGICNPPSAHNTPLVQHGSVVPAPQQSERSPLLILAALEARFASPSHEALLDALRPSLARIDQLAEAVNPLASDPRIRAPALFFAAPDLAPVTSDDAVQTASPSDAFTDLALGSEDEAWMDDDGWGSDFDEDVDGDDTDAHLTERPQTSLAQLLRSELTARQIAQGIVIEPTSLPLEAGQWDTPGESLDERVRSSTVIEEDFAWRSPDDSSPEPPSPMSLLQQILIRKQMLIPVEPVSRQEHDVTPFHAGLKNVLKTSDVATDDLDADSAIEVDGGDDDEWAV